MVGYGARNGVATGAAPVNDSHIAIHKVCVITVLVCHLVNLRTDLLPRP